MMVPAATPNEASVRAVPAAQPLAVILGSLAVGVAAITLSVLAPVSLQASWAQANEPAATVEAARVADSLFPVVATDDAISPAELSAIEAQIAEAEAILDQRRRASSAAVSTLARHAHGG